MLTVPNDWLIFRSKNNSQVYRDSVISKIDNLMILMDNIIIFDFIYQ